METMSKPRMSNIELLRIVAMALIIAAHLSYWGGAYYHTEGLNHFIASLFVTGGKLGVSLFVMIGSIFMAKRNMSCRAIFRIVLTMALVYFAISIAAVLITGKMSMILSVVYSITRNWFVNVYVGLMLISPWLNKLINIMGYKAYRNLCVVLVVLCAFFPTIRFNGEYTNEFIWFVFLYFLINFILKYKDELTSGKMWGKFYKALLKSYIFLTWGGYAFMAYMVMLSDYYFPLRGSGSVLMLAVALGIFFFFYRLKIDHNSAINWLAKGTFAAYLIHDYGHIRQILWIKILKCNEWFCSPDFVLYGFLTILGILLVGAISTVFLDKIVCCLLNLPIVKNFIKKIDLVYQIDLF